MIAESTLLRVVLSLALVYTAVGACAWLYSDRLMFLPPPPGYPDGPAILKVPTKDGQRVAAVYRKNPSATYTLLLSHGNAEDLGSVMPLLAVLGDSGFSVLAYDYRGYGRSEGTPSEPHVYADVDAAYDYLVRELQVEPGHVVAYGRSLGAGAALDLAVHRPLGGLLLESPFLSAFRVMTRVSLFPFDKFRNSTKIGRVRCPLLIMHGEDDEIVPFWHGRRLFDLAPEPKMLVAVPGAHHNDFVQIAGPRYAQALRDFEARLRGH